MRTEFIITDGKKYIRQDFNGTFKICTNITMAVTYPTKESALNTWRNSLTKKWQQTFYVAMIQNGEITRCNAPKPPKPKKRHTGTTYTPIIEQGAIDTWCKRLIGMDGIFDEAYKREREISQELSDIEQELIDIQHFIEFNALGAGDGYKIYAKERELLTKRRALKDERIIVNAINNNALAKDATNDILNVIKGLQKRVYEPRILAALFTDGVKALYKE